MSKYILGIDLGITAVKVCILNEKTEVKDHHTEPTNSGIPTDLQGPHEQSVPKIIDALNSCLSSLSPDLVQNVFRIGVCGQMHGVLFWKSTTEKRPWTFDGEKYSIDENEVSSLYTLQDARCDQEFLATLPIPDSHLSVSRGYGIPTIFWLKRNKPEYLQAYNHSGLISTFVVAMLSDNVPVYTSYQNAASWGYFNCSEYQWNLRLLMKADFPINLLPEATATDTVVGTLKENWYGIPSGAIIGVDLGDLQCYVLSTLDSEQDAFINLSTSLQIAFVVDDYKPREGPPEVLPLSYWPYFNNKFLGVAHSLSGENALLLFGKMLESWMNDLEVSLGETPWEKLIDLGMQNTSYSDLKFIPLCPGEINDPEVVGSVLNISGVNLSLGQVFKALCKGIMEALHNMVSAERLRNANINRIVGDGNELHKNQILRDELELLYQLPLVLGHIGDASEGAAIAMYKYVSIYAVPRSLAKITPTRISFEDELERRPSAFYQPKTDTSAVDSSAKDSIPIHNLPAESASPRSSSEFDSGSANKPSSFYTSNLDYSPIESPPKETSPIDSSPKDTSPIESSRTENSPMESSPIENQDKQSPDVPISDLPYVTSSKVGKKICAGVCDCIFRCNCKASKEVSKNYSSFYSRFNQTDGNVRNLKLRVILHITEFK